MLFKGQDGLIKFFNFIVKTVLLDMLVFGIFINLLVYFLLHFFSLLSLHSHLFRVLSDPDALIVQTLLLFIDSQLLSLLIAIHLSLLRGPDLVQPCTALLNKLAKLNVLVTLARLQTDDILV